VVRNQRRRRTMRVERGRFTASSRLPSLLLPCSHCGHRTEITTVAAAHTALGVEAMDLEDVTHGCPHCGMTVTRTVRRLYRA
jgi:predicted RNA-binding Zn-ribbon protein involved in translation (DUF1610 family)